MAQEPFRDDMILNRLLHNIVLQTAYTLPIFLVNQIADGQLRRARYISHVLNASADIRAAVRAAACEAVDAESPGSETPSHRQLVGILTMFEALSAGDKARFRTAFKIHAVRVNGGLHTIPPTVVYDPYHIPPILPRSSP